MRSGVLAAQRSALLRSARLWPTSPRSKSDAAALGGWRLLGRRQSRACIVPGSRALSPIGLSRVVQSASIIRCVIICICGVFGVVWAVGCRTRARLRPPAGRACTTRGGRGGAGGARARARGGRRSGGALSCAPACALWVAAADLRFRIVWEERLIKQSLKSDSLLTRSLTGGSSYVDHARAAHRSLHSHLTLG